MWMTVHGIHPAVITTYIQLFCVWTVELSLFCSTRSKFFIGRIKFSSVSFFHLIFAMPCHFCLSALFLFSAPQWTCWQAKLQKNSGRLNYWKILIKNGSFPCLTGQNPHNSFHHGENFVTVRQRVLLNRKGKVFSTGFSKDSVTLTCWKYPGFPKIEWSVICL